MRPLDDLRDIDPPDQRVFAITPASARILQDAKVWEDIASIRAPAFNKMQVWESVGSGFVRFGGDGASALGYVAENRVLSSALYDRLRALSTGISGLKLYENTSVASLTVPAAGAVPGVDRGFSELASIELKDGRALRARLVVGADGARSQTRTMAGVGTWTKDYEQSGVVVSVRVSRPHAMTAWQRFLPAGPLALLPLWSDMCSIVWSVPPAEARRLCSLDADALAAEVNAAFAAAPSMTGGASEEGLGRAAGDVLSRSAVKLSKLMAGAAATLSKHDAFELPPVVTEVVGKAASFPLKMSGANEYSRPRLALIGDAAHTVHPLAGQGLNLGIGDAAALADKLTQGATAGRDFGSVALLREYDGLRRTQVQGMQTALDLIKAVFAAGGSQPGLPSAVRTAGMAAIHSLGPLKGEMASFAMGSDSTAASKVVKGVGALLGPAMGTASSW